MTIDEMRAAIREARGLDQLRDSADPVERVSFLLDLEGEADAMLPVLDMIARLRSIEEAARAVAEQAQQDDCELCLAHRGHHYPDCTVPALRKLLGLWTLDDSPPSGRSEEDWTHARKTGRWLDGSPVITTSDAPAPSEVPLDLDGLPFCPTGYAQRFHRIGECNCPPTLPAPRRTE